ncbi:MAG: aspartate aminotransferase family protein [Alicyclobacillus sp.]|nr:aspartate aminotransferase family protein [Alicyclobacillus sp.]
MSQQWITSWPISQEMWQRSKQSLAGGVSTGLRAAMKPHPLFFSHGQGSKMYDVDGNTYIDYIMGWGPLILGHSHPRLVHAVQNKVAYIQTYGAQHHLEYEVAEMVREAIPGVERVLWSNTGSEAVQVALRLARALTGRNKFIKFEGHYHGWMDTVLVNYRKPKQGVQASLESRGQNPAILSDILIVPWNDEGSIRETMQQYGSEIAAVIAEPVLCNSGVIEPVPGFLEVLRELCNQTGAVLIFDEVITGFRIAYGGAVERFGVQPDLVVLAKAIAGGLPLSAVVGRAEIVDLVTQGVVHAGTFNGNPLSLAAAQATLTELNDPQIYRHLESLGRMLAEGMQHVVSGCKIPCAIHQIGPIVQLIPGVTRATDYSDFAQGDWKFYDLLSVELLRRGILVMPGGRWYLSTAHSEQDVAYTVECLADAIGAVVRQNSLVGGE